MSDQVDPERRNKLIELLEAGRTYQEHHVNGELTEEMHSSLLADGWKLVSMHKFPGDIRWKFQRKKC